MWSMLGAGLTSNSARTWPPWTVQRYLGQRVGSISSRQERDQLLAHARSSSAAFRFRWISGPAPRLRWFHQLPAGEHTCYRDLWAAMSSSPPRAAYGIPAPWRVLCLASLLHFCQAASTMHSRSAAGIVRPSHLPSPAPLQRKTVCVVARPGVSAWPGRGACAPMPACG